MKDEYMETKEFWFATTKTRGLQKPIQISAVDASAIIDGSKKTQCRYVKSEVGKHYVKIEDITEVFAEVRAVNAAPPSL